jgi:2-(1,2-epoxy-1,2-dihydrophenyl)acetyl-CoA isomerase
VAYVRSTSTDQGIVVVRLDRPERRNALTPDMAQELVDELRAAARNERPVVLTGSGDAFCAGADLKWLATLHDPAQGVAELVAVHHLAITTMVDMRVPLISAVNGAVAGGGLGLALAADYHLAARRATFTAAYFRLGLTPDGGSSTFLERTIGPLRTLELLLTNRRLTADEARAWGLLNEVVDDADLLDRATTFAASLAPIPGYALLQTRRLLDATFLRNQLQLESVAIRTAARGEFFRAALDAFVAAHPD